MTPTPTSEVKRCSRCKQFKPSVAFHRNASRRDGRQTRCALCEIIVSRARRFKSLPVELTRAAAARAREKGVPFSITPADVHVPTHCPVLGLRLQPGIGKCQPESPTLDRIIPSLGYVPGNILVISHKANAIKQNATPDELERVASFYRQLIGPPRA